MNSLSKIANGYGNLIKSFSKNIITTLKIILFLIFVFTLSILIVYPLWFLATESPEDYTLLVVVISLTLFIAFLIYKLISSLKSYGLKKTFLSVFFPRIKKVLFFFVVIFLLLLTVYIFTFSLIFGIVLSFLVFMFFGYIKFVFKS